MKEQRFSRSPGQRLSRRHLPGRMMLGQLPIIACLGLFLMLGAIGLSGCGGGSGKPVSVRPADKDHPQFIRIIVDRGFQPDHIVAQAGQPLQLEFYRDENFESCAKSLRIPDLRIEKELENHVPYRVNVPPHPPGELRFACAMNMMKGHVEFRGPLSEKAPSAKASSEK